MKKILGLIVAMVLFLSMAGIGTWAYFSDIEASQSNTLAAGTLDLKTGGTDGVSQTLLATGMAPGVVVGPATIVLNNPGSVNGASLDLSFSYVETDEIAALNPTNMTADQTAAMIEVTTLNYGGSSILGTVADFQPNGWVDIEDLMNANLSGQAGIGPSSNKVFDIGVTLRPGTSGTYQGDGITITMTFLLSQ